METMNGSGSGGEGVGVVAHPAVHTLSRWIAMNPRPDLAGSEMVHAATLDGLPYFVATNGNIGLCHRAPEGWGGMQRTELADKMETTAFVGERTETHPLDLEAFREWCGRPYGEHAPSGWESDDAEECFNCTFRYGWVYGLRFNRNVLARAIRFVGGNEATLHVRPMNGYPRVEIVSGAWKVFVMGLREPNIADQGQWNRFTPRWPEDLYAALSRATPTPTER